jgi:hypothetical protein
MTFKDFKDRFASLPVIPSKIIGGGQADANQLERWRKAGRVIRLRRGLYMLGEDERRLEPSRAYIAGQIYQPSYVSLEYALSVYGLIPERTTDLTSVSTRKTARFVNKLGVFIYQTVKLDFFRGFTPVRDEAGLSYFMADPEKALADFIYLNLGKIPAKDAESFLEHSFRFQDLGSLRKGRVTAYFSLFGVKKMEALAKAVLRLAGRGR